MLAPILKASRVTEALAEWRERHPDARLVFTNGCFDLLHVGHVRYLQEARSVGSALFVGLNSDDSIRRLKGPKRPLQEQGHRAEILASLRCVDFVSVFEEDTPEQLIHSVRPDVLVKGGDWKIDEIVGGPWVQSYGGQVKSLQFVDGQSSTNLVERVCQRYGAPGSGEA